MDSQTKARIEALIQSSPIFVFMKGSKLMPQCGFSNNVVQILNSLGLSFETFDVLSDMEIRQGIKEFSEWPTIPQVYVKGEFNRIGELIVLRPTQHAKASKETLFDVIPLFLFGSQSWCRCVKGLVSGILS